jgi:outer membrane protein TolC
MRVVRHTNTPPKPVWFTSIWLVIAAFFIAGCSARHYRKSADKEAAQIISEKSPAVSNMDPNFTIESAQFVPLETLPVKNEREEFLGTEAETEIGARILSLEHALEMAIKRSREYQNQKELVYIAALNLSIARWNYTPIFTSPNNNLVLQNQPKDVARAVDELAGTQTSLLQRDTAVVQQYNLSGRGGINGRLLLRSGAQLVSSFNVDFLKFLNGDASLFAQSRINATITQPLLRGAGYKVTMENLTQSERNMLYALRTFTQYRKDFAVRVAQSYYGILQSRDAVRNNYRGYQNFKQNAERGEAFAEEGRVPQAELGQLQQAALNAESIWINSIRTYKQDLDQFKILLGLPTDTRIVLDDRELEELRILHPEIPPDQAVQIALTTRLDLQSVREQTEDAARKIDIAANALKPGLDLVVSGDLQSKPGQNNPLIYELDRTRGSAGVNVDLPLSRKRQRNDYRLSLLDYERAERERALREDQIKLQIYDGWRTLDQARRNFELSELGVALAQRRVEEQELRAEIGRGTARDLVEAQRDLIDARNQRTSALVGHTIARLQFWRDMGILFIKENGQWEEVADAKRN